MRISLACRALVMALALVGLMAAPALAAPTVLSTDPIAGAEMHEPPSSVSMEFSEPLQSTSGLKVIDECDTKVSEGGATIGGTAMNEMSIAIGRAPHLGTYTVEYVATGVTGTATGSFTFYVHGGTKCDGTGGGGGHHHGGDSGGEHEGHQDGSGGSHEGHDSGGMDHGTHDSTGTHQGHDMSGHDTSAHDGSDHQGMDMSGHHHKKKHHHRGGTKGGGGNGNQVVAAGPGSDLPVDIPTGTTVTIALGLAIALGLVGGWVLRVSSPR
jgi:methionine-rich copper-binding protein CopC